MAVLLNTSANGEDPTNGSLVEIPIRIDYDPATNLLTSVTSQNESGAQRRVIVKDRDGLVVRSLLVPQGTVTLRQQVLNDAGFVTADDASGVLFEIV
jgi:hypothetical protein